MEKKLLRKRKGQWVTASMAVLSSVALGVIGAETVQAEEENAYVGISINEIMNQQPTQEVSSEVSSADVATQIVEVAPEEVSTVESDNVTVRRYAASPNETMQADGSIAELQRQVEEARQKAGYTSPSSTSSVPATSMASESITVTKSGNAYNTSNANSSGEHHSNVGQRDLIGYVIAAEAGVRNQDGINGVTSAIYNRADQQRKTPYEIVTQKYQFSGYGGGGLKGKQEPWRRYVNEDLSKVKAAITEHEAGYRYHPYTNFLASGYFYDDGTWTAGRNNARADLTPYVTGKTDIGGNTFFTPKSNFPWKSASQIEVLKGNSVATSPRSSQPSTTSTAAADVRYTDVTYQVQPSDSILTVADKYGLSVSRLREINNLPGFYIQPGTSLKVGRIRAGEQPAPSVTTPNTSQAESKYIVKGFDSILSVAQQHGVSVTQLRQWNNLPGFYIQPGSILTVKAPANSQPSAPAVTPTPNLPALKPHQYRVKTSDSILTVAKQYDVSVAQLREWNNLSGYYIKPGSVLTVKAAEEPKPSKPTVTKPTMTASGKYIVQDSDSILSVANRFKVSVNDLREWNKLSGFYVSPGSQLIVKAPVKAAKYDVKLNGKTQDFRTNIDQPGRAGSVLNYFGQRFNVTGERVKDGKTYLQLSQNGRVIGYAPKSAAVQVPHGKKTVYIDAGHGGSETGAYTFGKAEKDLNLNITRPLAQRLRDQGYIVYESRTDDRYINIRDREDEPNRLMPDIYVSVHHNAMPASKAGSMQGILSLYHDPSIDEPGYTTMSHHRGTNIIPEGRRLAGIIQRALVHETGARDLGARPQNLHVTRTTDMPAVLVELGFQDNRSEFNKLVSPGYQQKLIQGLVNGINNYFGATR